MALSRWRGILAKARPTQVPVEQPQGPVEQQQVTVVLATGETTADELRPHLRRSAGPWHVIADAENVDWDLSRAGVRFHPAKDLGEIVWTVRMIGPVDRLVNLRRDEGADQVKAWSHLFFHLKRRGSYLQVRSRRVADPTALEERLGRLMTGRDTTPADAEYERSVAQYTVGRDRVTVTKRNDHQLKLREPQVSRVLGSRGTVTTVTDLDRLPGGTLESAARLVSHRSKEPPVALDRTIRYPTLTLRHYRGPITLAGNCLAHTDYEILPESFPHSFSSNLKANRARNTNWEFSEVRPEHRATRRLAGDYYHLDCTNPGHFGHLMTDVLSRTWGWARAKAELPELKAIFRIRYPNERDPALERLLLTAAGIPEADIVWADAPVEVESLVGASPLWHNQFPHFVHPAITAVWDRVSAALVDDDAADHPEKIFVGRRTAMPNRNCRNAREVEATFAEHGWTILYPEDHDLTYQATVFAHARQIAGFGGSGLYNVMHARRLERLIVLTHEAYTARNEHLFAALKGGEEHYFWSTPDIEHPQGAWSEAAYYSAWEFDFDRNRAELEALLG